ncbi:hypothetical protein E2562_016964 [Oryza meyeriana var. granulata]|uniref:ferroxidase n=1 Tax=Oryza meyeriana var. granulata TaxID=110450 RepID=A0A6G1DX18_9ORYZ|nr:hypothetical protein E2562_016964 [Oryza meyeriana var. granulata]
MASRKLALGLTAARRLRSRSTVLVLSSPLLEGSTSTSHVAQSTGDAPGPSAVDYRSILPEDEYHKLADETIHDLLEKLEEYGDSLQMDGFDIDYGNQVLTLRLGELGTYVVNKQTPNRQIWLSSPRLSTFVHSGPSRFDWDAPTNGWIYRRTGANLVELLQKEIGELCGTPVELS